MWCPLHVKEFSVSLSLHFSLALLLASEQPVKKVREVPEVSVADHKSLSTRTVTSWSAKVSTALPWRRCSGFVEGLV